MAEGLNILHPVLVDFVVHPLKERYGEESWLDRSVMLILVNDQWRCLKKHATDRERIDHALVLVLRMIDAEQSQVFADKLPRICCSWTLELQLVRNEAAHRDIADCSDDDACSWLNIMWNL